MAEEQPLTTDQLIAKALHQMEQEPKTRESSLTTTKLQEAQMWLKEHERIKLETVRKHMGVSGGSPNGSP